MKNELKRAFSSRGMLLSIVLGQIINLYYIIPLIISRQQNERSIIELEQEIGKKLYMSLPENTPFDVWILGHTCQAQVFLLYFFPILAALPYAASYSIEKKSGYTKNVLYRKDRSKYRLSKCIASFMAGGTAVSIVLITNLMWCFTYIPYRMPTAASSAPLAYGRTMLGVMYYEHPFVYCTIYILSVFVFSGAISLISLLISEMTTNVFTVLLVPFLIIMLLNMLLVDENGYYLPMQFLSAKNSGYKLWMVPAVSTCIIILVGFGFIYANRKKDVL